MGFGHLTRNELSPNPSQTYLQFKQMTKKFAKKASLFRSSFFYWRPLGFSAFSLRCLSITITVGTVSELPLFLIEVVFLPLLFIGGLWLVKNGRPTLASHLIFIFLNTVIFMTLRQQHEPHSTPYLMLISVVAIATMS